MNGFVLVPWVAHEKCWPPVGKWQNLGFVLGIVCYEFRPSYTQFSTLIPKICIRKNKTLHISRYVNSKYSFLAKIPDATMRHLKLLLSMYLYVESSTILLCIVYDVT